MCTVVASTALFVSLSKNVLQAVDPAQLNQVFMGLLARVRAREREAGE
ncbi:MAG TPA: hypothetical protein VF043_36650 [Ktedonobacteraceae bacterium]